MMDEGSNSNEQSSLSDEKTKRIREIVNVKIFVIILKLFSSFLFNFSVNFRKNC